MRVFSGSVQAFRHQLFTNELFQTLDRTYPAVVGPTAAASERNSWYASLPRLDNVLQLADIPPDAFITLEERVPYFSKRMDACLFGLTKDGTPHTTIVELKAWGDTEATTEGNVRTVIGGTPQDEPHPSAQVHGYHEHLEDFCRAFQGPERVGLASCAYAHNCPGIIPDEGLFHPQFDALRAESPTFGEHDAQLLAEYFRVQLCGGRGQAVLSAYDERGVGPSKQLIQHAPKHGAAQRGRLARSGNLPGAERPF